MSGYKHILVAVDLSEDSRALLQKAANRARLDQAKLSVIHIDVSLNELYTGMIDMDMGSIEEKLTEEANQLLDRLTLDFDYPLERRLATCGTMPDGVIDVAKQLNADLIIAGHHHSFWSSIGSQAKQLMNSACCDLLIVPLKE